MTTEKSNTIIFGILGAMMMSLGGFVLYESYQINAEMAVIQEQIKKVNVHAKHWKLLSWSRDQINILRIKNGMPFESWPDLSHEDH